MITKPEFTKISKNYIILALIRRLSRPRPLRFQAEYHVNPHQTAQSHRHTDIPLIPQVPLPPLRLLQPRQVRQRWIRARTKLGMKMPATLPTLF